jgi:iron complex outermembrane recepter protein
MKKRTICPDKPLLGLKSVKLPIAMAVLLSTTTPYVIAAEESLGAGSLTPVTETAKPSDSASGGATLEKVTVEADAESDPYDPTDTNDPYNKSYSVSNSSTASKTDTPVMETPASIQVIPKSVLHDQQAFRLEDVIKNVSGVQTQHSFGGDYETFIMRGFKLSEANYHNGIRIPATKFDLANVERVEVLKGTSAMLYGLGDPGGFISTVTKQPSSTPYYSIEQRFGSYDFYRTEASATGPLSKEHGLNYRMDLSYLDANSFRDAIDRDRIFFAPTLSWDVSPDTKLTLMYEHFDENNSYDSGTPAFGTGLANIPRSRSFMQQNLTNTNTNDLIDFRIDHRFNDNIKLNAGSAYSHNQKNWETVYLGGVVEELDPTDPSKKIGDVKRNYWFGPEKLNSWTSFINGTFDFETYGVKHKVLLGGEYFTNNLDYHVANGVIDTINIFDSKRPNTISEAQLNQFRNGAVAFDVSTETTTKAIYLQDQMTFLDKFHIMGGFRYDWVERDQNLNYWDDPNTPNINEAIDSRSDDYVSPRVALLYEATDWLSVFGSFSESFGPAFDYDNGGPKLLGLFPSTQYEGGLKTQFYDGKLTANLAYFDLERTQFFNNNGFPLTASFPFKGHSNGVELDVQGQVYDGLSLIGTYAYTNTEIVEDKEDPTNVGNRLPYAPVHQGSLWLKYDVNYGLLKGLSFGAGVYTAGERFGDTANSFSDDAYARLDLMAGYKKKLGDMTLTTQLNINNVNDAEYFNLRRRRNNLPAEPLTVMGSIKLEY